jgi:hypothetical protein
MKNILFVLYLVIPFFLAAQAPTANQLMQLQQVTTTERMGIVSPIEGSIIYDSNTESLYVFTANYGWTQIQNEVNTYTGSFIISAAGRQSITGLPFQPSQITFTAHTNIEGYNIDDDNGLAANTATLQNAHGAMDGFARDDKGSTNQQVIYSGASGTSVNDISRYASSDHCIGLRYSSQNGDDLGKILGSLSSFDTNGFTIDATFVNGVINSPSSNPNSNVDPREVLNESVVVLFTAYR